MLARAVFFDMITDGDLLYNSFNGERCNIGIVKINDNKISTDELAKVHHNSIVIVDIPEETEALYNMIKYKHKLFDKDKDTYEISTPYIEKAWVLKVVDIDKKVYDFICFDKDDSSILNRYFCTKHILNYLNKHDMDLYTPDYMYELLNCIDEYIATTDFEKKVQSRLSHIICIYLRDRLNKGKEHSTEYYKYFEDEDTDDEIHGKLSSPNMILQYLKDIILDYEISILNGGLSCLKVDNK